jgi:phage recombination protein Bet
MAGEMTTTQGQMISFTPLGESKEISLSVDTVLAYHAKPTRSGAKPTRADVVNFIKLCEARQLNPYVGDAYLVGFDSQDGPQFNLITAHQALLKRAEVHPSFDGMLSGVIVEMNGAIHELDGDFMPPGSKLLGAWAVANRKDRTHNKREKVNLSAFDSGRSRWKSDKAGMIVKCAEASALRLSFPSQIAGLYCQEEMDRVIEGEAKVTIIEPVDDVPQPTKSEQLAAKARGRRGGQSAPVPAPEPMPLPKEQPKKQASVKKEEPTPRQEEEPVFGEDEQPGPEIGNDGGGQAVEEESPGWAKFLEFYARAKTVSDAKKLVEYAVNGDKLNLSIREREDADIMLSSLIENLESK